VYVHRLMIALWQVSAMELMKMSAAKLTQACRILLILTACMVLNTIPAQATVSLDENCQEKMETNLPVCFWSDRSVRPKACILMVHGLTQRACSMDKIARKIAAAGYLVWAIDQRGHGYWHFDQDKHAPGYLYNFKEATADTVSILEDIRKNHPNLQTYCIGESCGAAVIAKAAAAAPDSVNGLVLCSTGVKPCHVKSTWLIHDLLCYGYRFNHQFCIGRYQTAYCSNRPEDLPAAQYDPWVRKTLSTKELLRVKNACCGTAKVAKQLDPNISLLIVEGSVDHVLKPKSAKKVLDNARTAYKELVTIPNCGHVILGTKYPRPIVVSTINNWLDRQIGTETVAHANNSVTQ
jgi:alpha-beta hydrolase superfamily lysophospholipase